MGEHNFIQHLGDKLGIDNLEERVNQHEDFLKERTENIHKKYPITKEDILMFANLFYNIKLEKITRYFTYSEYMLFPGTQLIPFEHRNEIVNDVALKKIKLYFKLLQRHFIVIHFKDYIIHTPSEKNNYIQHLLEQYRVEKDSPQNRNFIKFQGYGESLNQKTSIWQKIKNIFKPKLEGIEIKREGANFFINDLLDERMDDFMENLDCGIDFSLMIYDKNLFVEKVLLEVEKFKINREKPLQIESLYNDIKEQIGDKINHPGSIKLSYPLSEYINNNNYYYDIIYSLHEKEYITVKEIYIIESSVNFVIEKINRFQPNIINELYPIYERITFQGGILQLDSETLVSGKKKGQKIYELIDIIVLGIQKYKRLEITYKELKDIYFENTSRFPYFKSTINKNGSYDIFKQKLAEEITDELKELYSKNLENLVDKVFCLSFFNSSLNKEKQDFILKENSTGLLINKD